MALAGCKLIRSMPTPINPAAGSMPALVEFCGFPALPASGPSGVLVVWIATGGSPDQVAQWFASALARDASPERFATAALECGPTPWRPVGAFQAGAAPLAAMVGSHRYRLALGGRSRSALGVQCWRYYPQGLGWQRRCGPMTLRAFIRHFAGRRVDGLAGGQQQRSFSLRLGELTAAPAPAG